MKFCVLSSGSKANCTYVEASGTKILIDCGLSGKKAEERLRGAGVDPSELDAIIITHEHHDHIHGVGTLSRKYRIPVYSNEGTGSHLPAVFHNEQFETGENFWVKTLSIDPVSISHDAEDPVGYVIRAAGFHFAHFTDLGRVTQLVKTAVSGAHGLVLESNHDQELLRSCDYSWDLKNRISSSHGHLSNDTATNLLSEMIHPELSIIVLAHLSENANTHDHALRTAHEKLGYEGVNISCGSVRYSLPVYHIEQLLDAKAA